MDDRSEAQQFMAKGWPRRMQATYFVLRFELGIATLPGLNAPWRLPSGQGTREL
jgi:hypothetical protein